MTTMMLNEQRHDENGMNLLRPSAIRRRVASEPNHHSSHFIRSTQPTQWIERAPFREEMRLTIQVLGGHPVIKISEDEEHAMLYSQHHVLGINMSW